MEGRICQTHAGVRGFPADLARTSGFPAETGSRLFGVGADGLVIRVGFGDSDLCFGAWVFGVSGGDIGIFGRIWPKPARGCLGLELLGWKLGWVFGVSGLFWCF
jgi:hypothetical protein